MPTDKKCRNRWGHLGTSGHHESRGIFESDVWKWTEHNPRFWPRDGIQQFKLVPPLQGVSGDKHGKCSDHYGLHFHPTDKKKIQLHHGCQGFFKVCRQRYGQSK